MVRTLLSSMLLLFAYQVNYAQYTNIINSNRPGHTESPYAVGINVIQLENTMLHSSFKNNGQVAKDVSNDLNIRYGFWLEHLEASLIHEFTTSDIEQNTIRRNITGTERLSVGLKYLIYEHVNKESPALKKSWKRRYGFKYNGLIPSVAASAYINTPLANDRFGNGKTSFSTSIITQNNISKKFRVNNQLDYHYIGGDMPELIYSFSSSYVIARRFNPYIEYRYHSLKNFKYHSIGVGSPFLVHQNLTVSARFNTAFGTNISGTEFGINASFRVDNHKDHWKYISKEKEEEEAKIINEIKKEEKEDQEFVDEVLYNKDKTDVKEGKKKKKKKRKKKAKIDAKNLILSY